MKIGFLAGRRLAALVLAAAALWLAGSAELNAQEVALSTTIRNHRFEPAELRSPAGRPIKLTVRNADPTPEEFESKTLRVERIIPGNSQAVFNLRPLQPGRYRFFGDFHEATAEGFLIVE